MGRANKGSGNWLVTYSDFITLLMTFFIVLYILTPGVQKEKLRVVVNSFNGQPGVLKGGTEVIDNIIRQKKRRSAHWNRLRGMVEAQGLQNQIKVDLLSDGIRIVLGEAITFNTGSAVLLDDGKGILNKLLQQFTPAMVSELSEIEILGNTDNVPISAQNEVYDTNWELGMDRAYSVLQFTLQSTALPADLFKVSSYGKYQPRYRNNSALNRKKNRRVEIVIRYKGIQVTNDEVPELLNATLFENKNYKLNTSTNG